jgi:putative endonuclease
MTEKEKWIVYIIETASGKLYTGITKDLHRRFANHSNGQKGAKFFHFSKPEKIVFQETHPNRSEATKREIEIKKMSRLQKQNLISHGCSAQDKS